MSGAIPSLPNTPSWRPAQSTGTALPLPLRRTCIYTKANSSSFRASILKALINESKLKKLSTPHIKYYKAIYDLIYT
jgi:hypothetical protein